MEQYLIFCKVNYLNPSHYESLLIYYEVKAKEEKLFKGGE